LTRILAEESFHPGFPNPTYGAPEIWGEDV